MVLATEFVDNLAPFESALARLSVAGAGIDKLEAALDEFRKSNRKDIVQRPDPLTGANVIYVRFGEFVPADLRIEASNVLAEIRHALDDAVGDAAVLLGRSNVGKIYFPVCKDAKEFEGEIRRKCRGVDSELVDYLRTLEPYNHGKGELIWALSALAGSGKHQRCLPLTQTIDSLRLPNDSGLVPIRPAAYPNKEGEIAIASGICEPDTEIGITNKIVIHSEVTGISFRDDVNVRDFHVRDFHKLATTLVLGIKAETERILRIHR